MGTPHAHQDVAGHGSMFKERWRMKASNVFFDALVSSARAPELADVDDLFGFLIGSWDLEAVLHDPTGQTQRSRGELHAAWVLEGRAIQDLFIFPRRSDR